MTHTCPQVPFNTMTQRRKPKAVDWVTFLRSAVPYTFYQVGPVRPREAFQAMIDALLILLDAVADYDPDNMDDDGATQTCRTARTVVARALFKLERDFPGTEMSIATHELIHVPDFLYRWNSVRNYWCFVVERLVGFMKTFVKNRSLSVENMVTHTKYTRIYTQISEHNQKNLTIYKTYTKHSRKS
jgi:hypothetical protein